jgi:hypothetical protein
MSQKRFALGRGITAHLHAMHTPWKPGSVERKKRRRLLKRQEAERKRNKMESPTRQEDIVEAMRETWDPTPEDEEEWAKRVVQIAAELEQQAKSNIEDGEDKKLGVDRNGRESRPYRESLPPFVQAAADGNLDRLKEMVDHWAAGGGHLSCLEFLINLKESSSSLNDTNSKKIRRRDGKTCLHYAARNGHLECIQYLLKKGHSVDDISGDGTTALHMACYGGHAKVAEFLMEQGANVHVVNDWGCGCAHWVGMTKSESTDQVRALCRFLQKAGVSFVASQKQGHSPLHKAAQRMNRHVIQWMMEHTDRGGAGLDTEQRKDAATPDLGGHRPSEIWCSVGGDEAFAEIIKREFEGVNT